MQRSQTIGNWFWIGNLWPNEPKRVNEGKVDKARPLFAEVPKMKLICVRLTEANGLVADEQSRAEHRHVACAPSGDVLRCLRFSPESFRGWAYRLQVNVPNQARVQSTLGEQTAEQIDGCFCRWIDFDLLDPRNFD